MKRKFHKLRSDETGVTSIEYALIASLIAIVVVVGVIAVGDGVSANFNMVETCLSAPSANTCPN